MKDKSLNERRIDLYAKLSVELDGLTRVLKEYAGSFSKDDFYSFSDTERRIKQYRERYSSLVADMAPHYKTRCELAANISSLLIEADRTDDECSSSLEAAFEEYARFERATASFSSEAQRLLKGSEISSARYLSVCAREESSAKRI